MGLFARQHVLTVPWNISYLYHELCSRSDGHLAFALLGQLDSMYIQDLFKGDLLKYRAFYISFSIL
jgi:hypothetical protein